MTNDIQNAISPYILDPPDDLVALYKADRPRNVRLGINILALPDAIKYTQAIQERTLIGKSMGLFALDDANDSNPFCYIGLGPVRGRILHLYHDGDTAVEFASLSEFLNAIETALKKKTFIDDLQGKNFSPPVDQQALCERIAQIIDDDTDEAECELTVLTPLLNTDRVSTVHSLAKHISFFVREAAAHLISTNPNPQLREIAETLANDSHAQVARVGKAALSAVIKAAKSR